MLLPLPAKLAALLPSPFKQVLRTVRQQLWRLRPPAHLFLFDGRVWSWQGFGRELYHAEPVFRASVQECERHLLLLGGKSIIANFEQAPDALPLSDEQCLLQLITVVQIALVDLWRAYGVRPDAVLGLSNGEVAAVYAAGGLRLVDALRVSLSNARISEFVPLAYGILQVAVGREQAAMLCAGCPVALFLMFESDNDRCFLLCALTEIERARQYMRAQAVVCHKFNTPPVRPYHTPVVTPYKEALREPLAAIRPLPLTLPCYLATLGQPLAVGSLLPADYWLMPHQQPVWQYTTMHAALSAGYQVVTPIGVAHYPYYKTRSRTLPAVRALAPFQAGGSEPDAFAAMRHELAQLGLVT